jgi:hypothetical protein
MRSARACVLGNQEYWLLQRGFFAKKPPSANDWPQPGRFRLRSRARTLRPVAGQLPAPDRPRRHPARPRSFATGKLWKKQADPSPWTLRGYSPKRPLTEDELFLIHARNCDKRGPPPDEGLALPQGALCYPGTSITKGSHTVVFGHWARHGLVRKKRIRGLDSGCVYGGQLSRMDRRNRRAHPSPRPPRLLAPLSGRQGPGRRDRGAARGTPDRVSQEIRGPSGIHRRTEPH